MFNIVLHVRGEQLKICAEFNSELEAMAALDGFKRYENAGEEYCIQEVTEPPPHKSPPHPSPEYPPHYKAEHSPP